MFEVIILFIFFVAWENISDPCRISEHRRERTLTVSTIRHWIAAFKDKDEEKALIVLKT